jgi:hypothetical protein
LDPAELDLPLDDPPVTATSGRDAGAEAETVLFSLRTGAGVELLLLNCWKNARSPFAGTLLVAGDEGDCVVLEIAGGVGIAVVLRLDFGTGRAPAADPVVLELIDPLEIGDATLDDPWASLRRFVRLRVHPPPNLPFWGGSRRDFWGEFGAEVVLLIMMDVEGYVVCDRKWWYMILVSGYARCPVACGMMLMRLGTMEGDPRIVYGLSNYYRAGPLAKSMRKTLAWGRQLTVRTNDQGVAHWWKSFNR